MNRLPRLFLATLCTFALAGFGSDYASVKQKFAAIESGRLPAGSRVTLTTAELNAYVRQDLVRYFPDGMRDPRVELGNGTATGTALIDFAKVGKAQGKSPGWLLQHLLEGERPVGVRVRIESQAGSATVFPDEVEISGMAISGPVLDYLIQNYLIPHYPQAKIGQPFALGHRIDRLEVRPGSVQVVIGR